MKDAGTDLSDSKSSSGCESLETALFLAYTVASF